ncbi:hypothetical protein GH825_29640, partial [Bacillus thuringiensis]|nr:hypothetical protein [Bacillus thuringiensis]
MDKVKLTCTARNKRKFNGLEYCGALINKRGPLGRCLRKKGRIGQNSYSSCIFDTCANQKNTQLAKNLACESVEAFASECGKLAGRYWRKKTGCLCPGELVRTTCGRYC